RRAAAPVAASSAVATRSRSGAVPTWLLRPEIGLCQCSAGGRRRKGGFAEKTLTGASGLMRQTMFSEDVASQPGFLQRLDARVKVVSLLGLLVVAALVSHVGVLAAMYLGTVALAAVSSLSFGFFVKRVWLFI